MSALDVSGRRIVIDTNVFISQLLKPDSIPAPAIVKAVDSATLLISDSTYAELQEVLLRRKFDKYLSLFRRKISLPISLKSQW